MSIPHVAGVCPPNDSETFESQQVASDCLWSDPAKEYQVKIMHSVVACARAAEGWRLGARGDDSYTSPSKRFA